MSNLPRLGALLFLSLNLAANLPAATTYTVLGWTEFGVNPMERGYSVFAIYPPYVTIHAQVIDGSGKLVKSTTGVQVTYESISDASGSINSTSAGKTDFWSFSKVLFGAGGAVDTGIAGSSMPGPTPQPMQLESTLNRFTATGVPLTPYDDSWNINYYPLMKITARDASGNALGSARVAVPVSNEVECRGCHAAGANAAAQPPSGYVTDPDPNRAFKLNILSLHDSRNARNPNIGPMLTAQGYSSLGLLATAQGGTPVRCDGCHASNRSGAPGLTGAAALTAAMHGHHASVIDPKTNDTLDNSNDRAACYNCHPGTATQGLRGAMGHSVAAGGSVQIQCQSCHGNLSVLADPARRGYVDLPACQACHTSSAPYRQTTAFNSSGQWFTYTDTRFATTSDGLFSASTGHGGLQCSACHGSTHGEYRSAQTNENYQSIDTQGAAGVIGDCTACHKSGIPSTNGGSTSGGPHGLHAVGSNWVSLHQSAARNATACQTCHGNSYQGTVLSRALVSRTLSTEAGNVAMFPGYQVGCYTCHSGPGGNGRSSAGPALSSVSTSTTSGQPATIAVSGASGATLRVVTQPANGTAWVSGNSIIYQPNAGFEGSDQIAYAAVNSANKDSNLATATVKVAATSRPSFSSTAVTSAASYAAPVSPGMIALIQGKGLGPSALQLFELNSGGFIEKAIGTAKVLFDGIPAPVIYSSDTATAAIVPYGVSGKAATNVTVQYNGITSTAASVPVIAALPGVFTADASGQGQAAAFNQDGTLNSASNPSARGANVVLYLTGDGLETPQPPDGRLSTAPYPATVAKVTVTIGGQPANVAYAGATPTAVGGLMQVNAIIPAGIPSGPAAVVVSCDGAGSQTGVVIQVK